MYYTYILECSDGTYYIGKTPDLRKRLRAHNGEIPGGAKYTRARRPVVLRYYEQYPSNSSAMQRENVLKQLTRKEKEEFIDSFVVCFFNR